MMESLCLSVPTVFSAASYTVLFEAWNFGVMEWFSDLLGIERDSLIAVTVLLSALPVAVLFRVLSGHPVARMWLSLTTGFSAAVAIWGTWDICISLAISLACYAMVYAQRYGLWPSAPLVFALALLCWYHYMTLFERYMQWKADVTTLMMLSVVRYSTFSYDFYDGRKGQSTPTAITGPLPGLLLFLSFVYSIFTVCAGPPLLFKHYAEAVASHQVKASGRATVRALLSLITAAIGMACMPRLEILNVSYLFTESFAASSLAWKLIGLYLCILCVRLKYYGAWAVAEVACLIAGLGWDGRATNADLYSVESSTSIQMCVGRWNRLVALWLKNCVYKRAHFMNKLASMALTRFVSAFWHGFYPGYYLTFLFLMLGDKTDSVCHERLGPWFAPGAPLHRFSFITPVCGWLNTFFSLSYYGMPFFVYSLERGIYVWRELYFCGHIFHLSVIMIVSLLVPKYRAHKLD